MSKQEDIENLVYKFDTEGIEYTINGYYGPKEVGEIVPEIADAAQAVSDNLKIIEQWRESTGIEEM